MTVRVTPPRLQPEEISGEGSENKINNFINYNKNSSVKTLDFRVET